MIIVGLIPNAADAKQRQRLTPPVEVMRRRMRALLMVFICSVTLAAQQAGAVLVTNQELLAGLTSDGSKWLIHHGNYFGHRYSPLTQITPQNVNQLKAQWTFQTTLAPSFQTTP